MVHQRSAAGDQVSASAVAAGVQADLQLDGTGAGPEAGSFLACDSRHFGQV